MKRLDFGIRNFILSPAVGALFLTTIATTWGQVVAAEKRANDKTARSVSQASSSNDYRLQELTSANSNLCPQTQTRFSENSKSPRVVLVEGSCKLISVDKDQFAVARYETEKPYTRQDSRVLSERISILFLINGKNQAVRLHDQLEAHKMEYQLNGKKVSDVQDSQTLFLQGNFENRARLFVCQPLEEVNLLCSVIAPDESIKIIHLSDFPK